MTASSTTEAKRHLLEAKGVSKRFGAVEALTGVDFEVDAGEVVALVGDNGAGKSTLIKSISGIQPGEEGQYFFDGREVSIGSPQDATGLGIATVYQDLALCDNLDVVANLFLGSEEIEHGPQAAVKALDEIAMENRALALLDSLSVTTLRSVRTEVGGLSGGQRQSVAIARSLLGDPKILILDEPTAALGVAQTAQVLDLVKRTRERGLGVIYISHNMTDIFTVADRVIVLRLGRRVATFNTSESSPEEVVGAITGSRPTSNGAAAQSGATT
ncbi:MAG: D-xylose transport system ATP-binding protein [Solirubrobacteraceae bacterium]|jgi:D-xylose transport system ATP-binding protein|nr:D-xylose transport system ATP-binding protein [Solirubrobacteraceae bacterium]